MLNEIYMLKKRILQLERLRFGTAFSDKRFSDFRSIHNGDVGGVQELKTQVVNFRKDYIEYYIPEEVMDLWDSGDYEVYTDANHHRKFWNEIENDCSVEYFLGKFFELIGVATSESNEHVFRLSLYDFNDFDIYFCSEEDMNKFLEEYEADCCTAFSRKDGYWVEEWSN